MSNHLNTANSLLTSRMKKDICPSLHLLLQVGADVPLSHPRRPLVFSAAPFIVSRLKPMCPLKHFFSWGYSVFFQLFQEHRILYNASSMMRHCVSISCWGQIWVKLSTHHFHLLVICNQSQWRRGGTNTTPTNRHTLLVLHLNNNGEVNIACLQILISLPDGIPKLPQYYEKWCLEKHFIRSASAIFHILWYSISLQPIKASQLKRSALKRLQLGVFCRVTQPYSHIVVGSIAI